MGRRACCAKEGVKRGAWTSKEDEILASYVKAHGEGRWRELPQRAGTTREMLAGAEPEKLANGFTDYLTLRISLVCGGAARAAGCGG
uniref:Ppm1c n=1 Tax=Triticum aestivum TaxID=4565 RepID=A0A2S1XUX1_WHEAT|nr:Ppm1c [Triticum aestivum]